MCINSGTGVYCTQNYTFKLYQPWTILCTPILDALCPKALRQTILKTKELMLKFGMLKPMYLSKIQCLELDYTMSVYGQKCLSCGFSFPFLKCLEPS